MLYYLRQDRYSLGLSVKAESINSFKNRIDKYWNDQEVKFNWKSICSIEGTGSRSNI